MSPAMNNDYRDLKERIQAAGLMTRRPRRYAGKVLATGGLLAVALLLFAHFRDPRVLALTALFLGVVTVQIAFLVHDAGHWQIFARRRPNALLGLILGDLLLGVSYGWWLQKH